MTKRSWLEEWFAPQKKIKRGTVFLPPELWCVVFCQYLIWDPTSLRRASQVCLAWREYALDARRNPRFPVARVDPFLACNRSGPVKHIPWPVVLKIDLTHPPERYGKLKSLPVLEDLRGIVVSDHPSMTCHENFH
jgi:hypothetical protein